MPGGTGSLKHTETLEKTEHGFNMGMNRRLVVVFACVVILVPTFVSAQSGFAGVVRDTSGAVLPGVTVEAASPALIERTRFVVTDDQGQYKLVDLRPGIYSVSFALPGFASVRRDEIELTANFTATVNADLRVGSVEETVTVSGRSPLVDVHSVQSQNVVTRAMLDALPTPRNYQAVAITTPGVTISRPDVGGSEGYQITNNTVHGSNTRDLTVQIDGLGATTVQGDGSNTAVYHNDLAYEELSYQTSGISAESPAGGIRISMVPKDGGNTFRGAAFFGYAPGRFQSDNFTPELRARGLRAVPNVLRVFDYNGAYGGPIKRDRLWFFATARYWGVDQGVVDSFDLNGNQGVNDNLLKNYGLRLTWQATPRNKIAVSAEMTPKWMGHHGFGSGVEPSLATREQKTPVSNRDVVKWTSPVTSRVLLEAGGTVLLYDATYLDHPGVAPDAISKVDLIAVTTRDAPQFNMKFFIHTLRTSTSATYVTGSHAFKTGMQLGLGYVDTPFWVHGDMIQQYRNGVPDAVQIKNSPVNQSVSLNNELALYVQDTWTRKRLTVNAGLRFDHINAQVNAQTAEAGRVVPARSFPAITNLPNWNDLSPRLGVAYDLFGDARTAVQASVSQYVQNAATGYAAAYNPMFLDTDVRTWRDLNNNNNIAEVNELGPSQNLNFGIRQNRNPDPEIERPFQMEYVLKLDRQLGAGVSVSGGYFRRSFHKLANSTNLATTLADYTPVAITSPLTGESIAVYNLNPARLGAVNILDATSHENRQSYNGFEATVDARVFRRLTAFGGVTIGRTRSVMCDVQDDPNRLRYCDQTEFDIPFMPQYKLSGSYLLPLGFQVSSVFASYPGTPIGVNYLVNRAVIPNLTLTQVSVPLAAPGSRFNDRLSQFDLRVGKAFRLQGVDVQGASTCSTPSTRARSSTRCRRMARHSVDRLM